MIHLWTSPEINDPGFYHHACLRELGEALGVEPSEPEPADEGSSGIHVTMVLARWLFIHRAWFRALRGPKVVVEHDAYLNFLPESPYYRAWTKLYRDCNFDLIISSGKQTTDRLREEGLPAVWVPKGANREFLDVPNLGDGRLGYFSSPVGERETGQEFHYYDSRRNMGRLLQGLVEPLSCPVEAFPETVAGFSGAITNDLTMGEPMAKQFECSALGCLVVRDRQPELYELGFVENESVLSYDSLSEMLDMVKFLSRNPEVLIRMGNEAREVARGHTWRHRALEVAAWVRKYGKARIYA